MGRYMFLDILDDAMKLVKRLSGLTVEVDVAREIQLAYLIEMLDDNSIRVSLSYQSQYLGMTFFAKDDNLSSGLNGLTWTFGLIIRIVLTLDALLQLQHHGASSIDNLDIVLTSQFVGFRWFTMST